jgi:hypothetical protein
VRRCSPSTPRRCSRPRSSSSSPGIRSCAAPCARGGPGSARRWRWRCSRPASPGTRATAGSRSGSSSAMASARTRPPARSRSTPRGSSRGPAR